MAGFFEIGSHELFAQGWLRTMILLISASWVARITGVSYWHPVISSLLTHWNLLSKLIIPKTRKSRLLLEEKCFIWPDEQAEGENIQTAQMFCFHASFVEIFKNICTNWFKSSWDTPIE
jgi:hypothetical protein